MTYFSIHNHTDASNIRLKDSINTPKLLIDTAINKGLKGICLTDHESLSNHYSFWNYYNQLKNKNFKIGLGNEIYLVDKEKEKKAKENKEKIHYYHFILLAKDMQGIYALRELSSLAWKNSYYYRGMERVPTYKKNLKNIMNKYKGHVVGSSACVGGELPQLLLKYNQQKDNETWNEINDFVKFCVEVFGKDDFYFELQPSHYEEQKIVNDMLLTLSKHYGIKAIVTTDAHYPTLEDKETHKAFLQSQQGEREVDMFYDTTYVMSEEELLGFFDENTLNVLMENTLEIMEKIEEYQLNNTTIIPKAILPEWEWLPENYLSKVVGYENIIKMINSQYEMDHYYIKQVLDGIDSHPDTDWTDDVLSRVDLECSELIGLTEQLEQPMSSYFVLMRDLIDIMWTVSLVGTARGSASCWLTNYLIGITQVNALKFKLPHQRFLTKERVGSFPKR